jgi:glycerophosphoryl diester phosphodiesterase
MHHVITHFSARAILAAALLAAPPLEAGDKVIIAHRGASGYLPEHTLEAYAYAYAQGADYVEPDLMMSKDGVLIALHDRSLNATTDVAARFPERARENGEFFPSDFTVEELKQLRVQERVDPGPGKRRYPARWRNEHTALHFRIPTLAEIIELVQGLNQVTGRNVGLGPEIKSGPRRQQDGLDPESALLRELTRFGLAGREDPVIIQSFDAASLRRLRALGCEARLVQLIGGKGSDDMVTPEGLEAVAGYANGIGLNISRLFDRAGRPVDEFALVRAAQARGLVVYPYTARADDLPAFAATFEDLLGKILFEAGADGVFTDHPGRAVDFLRARGAAARSRPESTESAE